MPVAELTDSPPVAELSDTPPVAQLSDAPPWDSKVPDQLRGHQFTPPKPRGGYGITPDQFEGSETSRIKETAEEIANPIGQFLPRLSTATLKQAAKDPSKIARAIAAVEPASEAAGRLGSAIISPMGVGAGALGGVAGRIAAAGFAAPMIANAGKQSGTVAGIPSKDRAPGQMAAAIGEDAANLGMGTLGAFHAVAPSDVPAQTLAQIISKAPLHADIPESVKPIIRQAAEMGLPRAAAEAARTIATPDVNATFKNVGPQKRARIPDVPATPKETSGENVAQTIRKNNARTTKQIQDLFPASNLTRQQAAKLRRDTWGIEDVSVQPSGKTIPETDETIKIQIDAAKDPKNPRAVVYLPESGKAPEGTGLQMQPHPEGGVVLSNPDKISKDSVSDSINGGNFHELLGHVEKKEDAIASGQPKSVLATDAKGNELSASVVSESKVEEQKAATAAMNPGAKVEEVDPAKVVEGRKQTRDQEQSATSIKNTVVDKERSKRGLPPAMQSARQSFGEVWDKAMSKIESQPDAGLKLVEELKDKPRALTAEEDAILLHHQITLQNQFDKVSQEGIEAQSSWDSGKAQESNLRAAQLSDQLKDAYDADKAGGRETGRGLAARKMMANEDYTLAKMEMRKRAANEGRPLTDNERSEIQRLQKKVADTQKALDDHLAKKAAQKTVKTPPYIKRIIESLDRQADAARLRIKERAKTVSSGVDPTLIVDLAQIGASHIAHGIEDFAEWSDKMKEELGTKIEPYLKAAFDQAKASLDQDKRLDTWKRAVAKRTEALKAKTASGDFGKAPKKPPVQLDSEALRLRADNERAKQEFQNGLTRDRLEKRTKWEKIMDALVKWRRGFILSGPATIAKLTAAAVARSITTPAEELAGGVLSQLPFVRQAASKAPREGGGLSVRAEAKAITEGITTGAKDAWQVLRTGKSDLDTVYGKDRAIPQSFIDIFGNIHGALKAPVKRAEFARSFQKRAEFYAKQGVDITDDIIQTRIGLESYQDAERAIFMQKNLINDMYKQALQRADRADKKTGHPTAAGKAAGATSRILIPIVKVPTNIVAETMQYALGSITGSGRLGKAFYDGIENLSSEDADLIMRQLKKGSLGGAVMLAAYLNPTMLGGFYQQGEKRNPKDIKPDAARIGGVDIPPYLIHNPFVNAAQIGATVRRVSDSKLRKKDAATQGLSHGAMAGAAGLADAVPFVREMTEIAKGFNPYERDQWLAEMARSMVIPQAVQSVAQAMDKNPDGTLIHRKPTTIKQGLQSGIPGLRHKVPASKLER